MSEFDSLSDSDWLDISSGRDSDNDSLSDPDSDREEIRSMPQSRRSSISNGSSMNGDVEAWEGFVSDSGDEANEAVTGMYPVPLPSALGAEPIAVGFNPNVSLAAAAVEDDEEDQRVRAALDQSFVGTLNASRSSTTSGHFSSTHTSIRDLRLSFPDPLTSSRDELNRSYEAVSPTETTVSSSTDGDEDDIDVDETTAPVITSPFAEDPGLFSTTPEVRRHEGLYSEIEERAELAIVLYGTSSEIKWKFVQQLIQKAAIVSGQVLINTLQDGDDHYTQTIFLKKSADYKPLFFNEITVLDRTGGSLPKAEVDIFDIPNRHSLAIVYLPATKLPVLSWHTSYLPVLVPSTTLTSDFEDNAVMLQAAEDDWDLSSVPATKTLKLGPSRSPVFDCEDLSYINPDHAYQMLHNLGQETKKVVMKPITEQVKSVNAVTLFALMSIIMGFAFNTAFRPSTPAPTPTVNAPSATSSPIWGMFAPEHNRSVLSPSGNTAGKGNNAALASSSALKDMALSVFNPGATSLSVTPPPSSKSLNNVASTSKGMSVASSSSGTKCLHCKSGTSSALDKARTSTDMAVRATTALSDSDVHMKPSVSVASRTDGGSTILLGGDSRAGGSGSGKTAKATLHPKVVNSVSEVLEATTKALAEVVGNDLTELAEAADELLTTLRVQTEQAIKQSKGKARALGAQLHGILSDEEARVRGEVSFRNERAKTRAKEFRKKGGEFLVGARDVVRERTVKAKKRAREIGKRVVESEAWVGYQKAHGEWEGRFSGNSKEKEAGAAKGQGKDRTGKVKHSKKEDKENFADGSTRSCVKGRDSRRSSRVKRI
ncbi:hypothetical protein B0H34DRAFT_731963 [Crassisporium funariophilum]|nr:hypothetical protein B0H34DRAFT_731963 [Crassisporium funariophilum]